MIYGEISGRKYARESFIAAKCAYNILAPACFQGTCNTALFNFWIQHFLVPTLKHGQELSIGMTIVLKNQIYSTLNKFENKVVDFLCSLTNEDIKFVCNCEYISL